MKHALTLGIGIVTLAALPALAADLPPRMVTKSPVMVAQVYNWSGCYIGGNAGGKWTRTTDDVSIGATAATPAQTVSFGSDTNTSFIGGGQIGCQWQSGSWVFGLEGDADWQRSRTTRTLGATPLPANVLVGGDSFDVRSDWQASARGRLGYAWDRMLLYVTGGAAFTNVKVGSNFIATGVFPASATTDSKTLVGATVGGGVEYALSQSWSLGVEGRWSWYGNQTFSGGTVAAFGPVGGTFLFAPASQTLRIDTFEVTGRLNYKFDWGGPVVARY
jgi:outer membrane immunogenic protein